MFTKKMEIINKEVPSSQGGKVYNIRLAIEDGEFIPEASNCTCVWGSVWRFSKNSRVDRCIHMTLALNEHDEEERIRFIKLRSTAGAGVET